MNYLKANERPRAATAEVSQLFWQTAVLMGLIASFALQLMKF